MKTTGPTIGTLIAQHQQQQPQARIVGGSEADPSTSRFPYYVALLLGRNFITCGGSLVAPDVV